MNDYIIEVHYDGVLEDEILKKDETLFHVANGFIGKKGFFTEGYGFKQKNTVVINGFYNTYKYHYEEQSDQFPLFGKTIMPLPEPFQLDIFVNGQLLNQAHMKHIHTTRRFLLLEGCTKRETMYENDQHQRFVIKETIFAHAIDLRIICVEIDVISLDIDAKIDVHHHMRMPYIKEETSRDPRVAYEKAHLKHKDIYMDKNQVEYQFETLSKQFFGSFKTNVNLNFDYKYTQSDVCGVYTSDIKKGETFYLNMIVVYDTNHVELPYKNAQLNTLEQYKYTQKEYMTSFWASKTLTLDDAESLRVLRYHMYQLYHSGGALDELSIAAKGLSGEGYEGHYFWDTEMYMLPYFVMHHPKRAKHILKHRLLFIEEAKHEARQMGIDEGAKIPWRSIDGTELSPYFPAGSTQLHINSDVSYGYILYVETTGDDDILKEGGFELLVELGLYILNYGFFDDKGFHLPLVTGPDEYTPLVFDNFYTNTLAKMHLEYIIKHYEKYQSYLTNKLDEHTRIQMKKAVDHMTFYHDETLGIHLQDLNHLQRKPLEKGFLPNHGKPLLLKHHPHVIYRHRVLKQADSISAQIILNQYDRYFKESFYHYLDITSHDSSLSKCMYGIGAYHLNDPIGDDYFKEVLYLDFNDLKKHTKHGLHLANTGGAYLMFLKGLLGIHTIEGLCINPSRSEMYKEITYRFTYRGVDVFIDLKGDLLFIEVSKPLEITIWNQKIGVIKTFKTERVR